MADSKALGRFLENMYTWVSDAAEIASTVAEVVDNIGLAVQDGIDHIEEVYPHLFEDDEDAPVDEETYTESDAFTPEETDREKKIREVTAWLMAKGQYRGIWKDNPENIPDHVVNIMHNAMVQNEEGRKRARGMLNNNVSGNERFGPVDKMGRPKRYGQDENTF